MKSRTEQMRGFTLLELMVVLLIAGLTLGLGVPAFNQFIATNTMAASVNDLVGSLHLARGEAVKRRFVVVLCATNTPEVAAADCDNGAGLEDGWIVFVDNNGDGSFDGNPEVIVDRHGPLDGNVQITMADRDDNVTANAIFAFDLLGQEEDNLNPVAVVEACDNRGDKDVGGGLAAGRVVRVTPTGRPQIYRERAHVQDANINPLGGC